MVRITPSPISVDGQTPVANFIVRPEQQQRLMVTYLAMEGHWDSDYHDMGLF